MFPFHSKVRALFLSYADFMHEVPPFVTILADNMQIDILNESLKISDYIFYMSIWCYIPPFGLSFGRESKVAQNYH